MQRIILTSAGGADEAMVWRPAAATACFLLLPSPAISLASSRAHGSFPAPPGLEYFGFQTDAIAALKKGGVLLCDEMGLGKTVSAIGALNALEDWGKVLIVAPKSLLPMWETELDRWLVIGRDVYVATAKSGVPPCEVLLINYDIVSKYRKDIDALGKWDVLICDEAHYLKSVDAVRTRAILGDTSTRTNKGAIKARRKWFLTGSPVLNNPIELYPLLKTLDPKGKVIPQLRDMDDFCDHYCGRKDTPWGVTYKGGKNLSELGKRLRSGNSPLMLRRTKNDVLRDLPDKRHQLLPLEDEVVAGREEQTLKETLAMGGSTASGSTHDSGISSLKVKELKTRLQARGLPTTGRKADLVDRLRQHAAASSRARLMESTDEVSMSEDTAKVFDNVGSALRSETGGRRWEGLQTILKDSWYKGGDGTEILGALAKARHATALEKVPYAIELIDNALESHKVVVFAHHRDVQDALMEAFEERAVVLHGGSTQEERADAVQRFQQDESVRLFIGSIRAAGVGITLTAASHVLFVEFDWSPMMVQQAEDRTHRVGQQSSVLVQYLFFRGTIDEHLASLLVSKQITVAAVVEEPTGAASWSFDFGKHKGETVADVAASDAGYLEWIVEERAHVRNEDLNKALQELGYVSASEDSSPEKVNNASVNIKKAPPRNVVRKVPPRTSKHGEFIMPFGKHKGKRLADVPIAYRGWLISSGASRSNFRLDAALRALNANVVQKDNA